MKPLGALVQEEATIGSRSWEPAPKDPVQDLRRTLQSRVVVGSTATYGARKGSPARRCSANAFRRPE